MKKRETSFKQKIFRYFALLLSNQDNSRNFSNSVIAISFLQNIGLTLQNSMSLIEVTKKQPLVYIINQIANMMTLSFWISSIGAWSFYPYFRIIVNLAIFFFFILLIIVFKKVNKAKNSQRLKNLNITGLPFLKKTHTLLVPILIQYILEMLLPTAVCKEFIPESYKKNLFAYNCKSPLNILYIFIVISWVQAVLCTLYTGFIAYLGFDESISRTNKLGKRNNQLDFWVMFGKIYLVTWNIFIIPSKFTFGVYFVSYFIVSLHEITLAVDHVFYDYKMYKFFLTFFFFEKGVFLSFSLMNMLDFQLFGYNLDVVVLIFVLIFMAKLASNLAYRVAIRFRDTEEENKSESYNRLIALCCYISCYEKKIINFPRRIKEGVVNKSSFEFFNILIGIIRRHLNECVNIRCFCQRMKKLPNPCENKFHDLSKDQKIIFNSTFLKHFVKNLLLNPLLKHPSNLELRFSLIDHLFTNMEHMHLTVVQLILVLKHVKNLQKRYRIFKIKDALMLYLDRKNTNAYNVPWMSNFDIEAISKLEKNYCRLEAKIKEYKDKLVEFLDLAITSVKTDLNKVEKCHLKMLKIEEEIEEIYEEIQENPRSMKLYCRFKRDIKDDLEKADEIEKKIEKAVEKIKICKAEDKLFYDINLMFDEDTAIIMIGALKDNMGMIVRTNQGAVKLTGYSLNHLRAFRVDELMPEPFKKNHQGFLLKIYKTGISYFLYTERQTFIRVKKGFLLPVVILIKPLFDPIKNDFLYISYLQGLNSSLDFMLIGRTGRVIGLTQMIADYFGWFPRNFDKNNIYIQNIIPGLYDFFSSIFLTQLSGDKLRIERLISKIKLKRRLNGYFQSRCYNNKLPYYPFPKLTKQDAKEKSKDELMKIFSKQKKQIYRVCNNLNNKYDLEFFIEEKRNGRDDSVLILKIRSYVSINDDSYRPIKSYFCKKYCRLIIFYMKFVRLLKKVRRRKALQYAETLGEKMLEKKQTREIKKNPNPLTFLATGIVRAPVYKENRAREETKKMSQVLIEEVQQNLKFEKSESEEDLKMKNQMLKELQEGSVNSASSVRGTNTRLNVKNSIKAEYFPTSFKLLKSFTIFLIVITFSATQLLLVYQTIYYKKLRKSLETQSLLFQYEHRIQKIIHLNMNLYLLGNKYLNFKKSTKILVKKETEKMMSDEIKAALNDLKNLKQHKEFLNEKFNGKSLNSYLSISNKYHFNNSSYDINFLLSTAQTLRSSFDILRLQDYKTNKNFGKFKEIFDNYRPISNSIMRNLAVDPYRSFLSNSKFVITLILTSLVLNTLNGISIIKSLYNSLKYLDRVFQLVTTMSHFDLTTLRYEILSLEKSDPGPTRKKKKKISGIRERYSKDFVKVEKPMIRLSCAIFLSIFLLSGFYLLSLFALGFFGGEVEMLLTLKRKIFEIQSEYYDINFDLENFVFRDKLGFFEENEVMERLKGNFRKVKKGAFLINKDILRLKQKNLRDELLLTMSKPICQEIPDNIIFGIKCEVIRNKILTKGFSVSSISIIDDFERLIQDARNNALSKKHDILYEFQATAMMEFSQEVIKQIQTQLNKELYSVLKKISKNAITVNIILIVVLTVLTFLLWNMFIKNFSKRIIMAKTVFNIYPKMMIIGNAKVKRFLNNTCNSIVIN